MRLDMREQLRDPVTRSDGVTRPVLDGLDEMPAAHASSSAATTHCGYQGEGSPESHMGSVGKQYAPAQAVDTSIIGSPAINSSGRSVSPPRPVAPTSDATGSVAGRTDSTTALAAGRGWQLGRRLAGDVRLAAIRQ
jgi:hypothetical protein